MKDDIKIQINSKEALERLIGADPEGKFSLELRDNVANWFTEVYFKNLLDKETLGVTADVKKKLEAVKKEIVDSFVVDMKKDPNRYYGDLVPELKDTTKNLIEMHISKCINKQLQEAVGQAYEKVLPRFEIMLKDKLEKQVSFLVEALVREQVTKQLASTINHLQTLSGWAAMELKTHKKEDDRNINLHL